MPRKRTHWEGCWRTHHNCALVRIAALEASLAERTASERLSHEIADRERERREAAESTLRRVSLFFGGTLSAKAMTRAHFARYKD